MRIVCATPKRARVKSGKSVTLGKSQGSEVRVQRMAPRYGPFYKHCPNL